MVELIIGEKGKGKTKVLLDKVNEEIKEANGSFVYLDNSSKHMYELNNKVRLIDVSTYDLNNADQFIGFVNGIISQDHDLEKMYFDNFISLASCDDNYEYVLEKINEIATKNNIKFVVSISKVESDLSDALKKQVIAKL